VISNREPDSPLARLFIALDLPPAVIAGVAAWGATELHDPALRAVPEGNLHITLVFLGSTPFELIPRVATVLLGSGAEAPLVQFSAEPVGLPRRGRPARFALEARSRGVEEIQAGLGSALAEAGLHQPETRPFWPHLTVARVRRVRGNRRKTRRVEGPPGPLPEALLQPFRAVRMALYLSSFGPDGVRYTPLAQVELHSGEAAVR